MDEQKRLLTKELMKPVIKKYKRRPVITTSINDIWGADLLDVSNMSKYNKNITFLLIIVDIYSRYAFVIPIKHKSGEDTLKAFEKLKTTPHNLWVDEGKEFFNSEMKAYCKKRNINMYHTYTGLKSVFAERFNRTLRDLIFEYLNSYDTKYYLDELPKLVEKYNNTFHKSIKETPYNVYVKGKPPKQKIYLEDEEAKFKIGDYVRKVVIKKLFEKGYTAKWSEDIFIIDNIDDEQVPIMYGLKDLQGDTVKGKFYKNQLLKSDFRGKVDNNKVKEMIKEGKVIRKIKKLDLGEVRESKRVKVKNKKYV
jgi:hypothetical protein